MSKFLRIEPAGQHTQIVNHITGETKLVDLIRVVRAPNEEGQTVEQYNTVEKGSFLDPESELFRPELSPELDFN